MSDLSLCEKLKDEKDIIVFNFINVLMCFYSSEL